MASSLILYPSYGQTSSGKSYTMGTTGTDTDYTIDSSRTGIIPRAVKDMFGQLEQEQRQAGASMTWECKVSFLELYNEVCTQWIRAGVADVCISGSHRPAVHICAQSNSANHYPRRQGQDHMVRVARGDSHLDPASHAAASRRQYSSTSRGNRNEQGI